MISSKTKRVVFANLLMASLLATTAFSACRQTSEQVDDSKSQLYVGNLYAGFGDDWMQTWKTNFEKMHADTSFEEGKKGVQIWVDNQRDSYTGANLLTGIESYTQDMYFTEDPNIHALVAQGACAKITDIVTENLKEKYGEDSTIEEKMSDEFKAGLKLNGDYYILPVNESYMNIIYDIDLFESKGFFISKESTADKTKFTKIKLEYSKGPDNVEGTSDDGLPATFSQFYDLLNKIKQSSVTPMIWSGKYHSTYGLGFATSVWAAIDGKDQYLLNDTFNNQATTLVSSVDEKTKTYGGKAYDVSTVTLNADPTEITKSNGYELQKQAGKFYALQFIGNIIKDSTNYDTLSFSGSLSQTGAQTEYLYSKYNTSKKRVAMLMDGSWWSVEAKSTFANMEVEYGEEDSRRSRRFGLMPIPSPTQEMVGLKAVYDSSIRGAAFVSAYCPDSKLKLAKEFLQYCYTNEGMKIYTSATDTPMPYKYNFASDEEKSEFENTLTTYGKALWNNHENDAVFFSGLVNDSFYVNNYSYFNEDWDFRVAIDEYIGKYPFTGFQKYPALTAKKYFEGLYNYHKNNNLWK